jgi:hypothetical protein
MLARGHSERRGRRARTLTPCLSRRLDRTAAGVKSTPDPSFGRDPSESGQRGVSPTAAVVKTRQRIVRAHGLSRRARLRTPDAEVQALHAAGWTIKQIAEHVGDRPATVSGLVELVGPANWSIRWWACARALPRAHATGSG